MEINEIKQSLGIHTVLSHYHLQADKNKRLCCPFHEDKRPSMQVYLESNTVFCFSSNCKLHGKAIDAIDFIMHKEECTKHEAINKAKELLNHVPTQKPHINKPLQRIPVNTEIITKTFSYFKNGFVLRKDNKGRLYLQNRGLDVDKLASLGIEIGYNSAQFHHRGRISQEDMQACEQSGLLIKSNNGSKSGFSYTSWAGHCVIFPLKDAECNITGLYGRSTVEHSKNKPATAGRHYYLKGSKGLFYTPKKDTKRLIITESIIDFLSLYQIDELREQYDFMPIYGTNRLTSEHTEAVSQWFSPLGEMSEGQRGKEIIFFLDGDKAGGEAISKYSKELHQQYPSVIISKVETPESEDINSLLQGHEKEVFTHLLNNRVNLFLSNEKKENTPLPCISQPATIPQNQLITTNPNNLIHTTQTATYYIKGGIRKDLDSLKVTLVIEHSETKVKSRNKLDLYEDKQTETVARKAAEKLDLRADLIEIDLSVLTDLLDNYRESMASTGDNEASLKTDITISRQTEQDCITFLKQPNLLQRINDLIGQSGVVGEENNRIFLFGIASSYNMEETLHALIQGSSGSGKTHLLATIMDFMPPEDTISLTRVTESSFYNYGQYELQNKLIGMEDYDGLEEKAELAFRELQSKGMISSSTSGKNEQTGEITGYVKTVYGPIASLSATTKGEIYEDNMSRCFLVAVDESAGQTANIIKYQNQRAAGKIDKQKEKEVRSFLQNCVRLLKLYDVINPYADRIELPKEAHKIRRLNDLFQSYVKQVTILNQYQRQKDKQGRLITDKEDVKTAIEIMFDSIILKVDELDGSLRNFYEKLKVYVLKKGREYEFTQREVRHELHLSKSQLQRNINMLLELEYLQRRGVGVYGATTYKIMYWDNNDMLRNRIKENLDLQLDKL
jgi:DNA primase/energy-coupling factor transporter ATP-binding protein EcfA2